MKKETKERFLEMLDFYLPTITLVIGLLLGTMVTALLVAISN